MKISEKHTYKLLYFFLLTPVLAYFYTSILGLPKNINVASAFPFFLYGILFLLSRKQTIIPKFIVPLAIFAFYKFIWIQCLGVDTHILTHIYHSILFFAIALAILIIYNTKYTDEFIANSIFILKFTIITTFICSLIQVFEPDFLDPDYYFGRDEREYFGDMHLYKERRTSIFGLAEPNALGLSFIPMLSILVGFMLFRAEKRYFIYLTLGILIAVFSNGRYIMIGAFLVTFQIIVYYRDKLVGTVKYLGSIIVITFFLYNLLLYFGYDFSDWYETRLFAEGSIEETTRYKAVGNFLRFFPEKPFLGTGELTSEIEEASRAVGSSHIHVGYLSHLVYYGTIGCFFLFGFWFLLAKKLYRTAKATNYWGSFFAFLVFLWSFATMSQSSILYPGLMFALVFDKYFQDKNSAHKRNRRLLNGRIQNPTYHWRHGFLR